MNLPPPTEFPRLQTQRLILRQIRPTDVPAIFNLYSNKAVTQFNYIQQFTGIDQAYAFVENNAIAFAQYQAIRWAITLPNSDTLIGTCGCTTIAWENIRAELGYDLLPAYWRQGFMTEALSAIIHFGFTILALNRLEAAVFPANTPSITLLHRLGFTPEGTLRQFVYLNRHFYDITFFSLLRQEYTML